MTERPILFSGAMVRAILEGRKTQTRRVIANLDPACTLATADDWNARRADPRMVPFEKFKVKHFPFFVLAGNVFALRCPYGEVGDRLWVRETWNRTNPDGDDGVYFYRATDADSYPDATWRPSIFMPRVASRITLEVTDVRVQRLQEISEDDARAEGVELTNGTYRHYQDCAMAHVSPVGSFQSLWDSINAKRSPWQSNPFVWAITFKRINP